MFVWEVVLLYVGVSEIVECYIVFWIFVWLRGVLVGEWERVFCFDLEKSVFCFKICIFDLIVYVVIGICLEKMYVLINIGMFNNYVFYFKFYVLIKNLCIIFSVLCVLVKREIM